MTFGTLFWGSVKGSGKQTFAPLGTRRQCVAAGLSTVLVPSVGLCVHPWLFADHGLTVTATDIAGSALAAVSEPHRWARLYSRAAFERWDIAESASYASQGNPHRFARMPDLEAADVREALRQRIAIAAATWDDLPLASGSVDALFATNALPRTSASDQRRVLNEWVRVVKPGGAAFIAQHNFVHSEIEAVLQDAGWTEVNWMAGECPAQAGTTGFQVYYSSG